MTRRMSRPSHFALAAGLLVCGSGFVQGAFPTLALKPVVLGQVHAPTNIVSANDGSGRLFVCDQLGKIYIVQGGMMIPTPFLNLASTANAAPNNGPGPVVSVSTGYSERGLLGLAFHPGFANPASPGYRKFYVNYVKNYVAGTDPAPPQAGDPVNAVTVVAEFQVSATNPNAADPASERRLLMFTQPQSNHNGGQLLFGPDGHLYIGTGDGGGSNDNGLGHTGREVSTTSCLGNGQDKTRFLGKILRIDPLDPDGAGQLTYGIPAANPFVGAGGGVKEEIYAFGLRNPWRFSFDQRAGGTNRLFCGDVGQGRIEEINLIVSGGNYGWRYKEGHEFPGFSSGSGTDPMADPGTGPFIAPIASYAHPGVTTNPVLPQLGLSVTGGFVYRGTAIPALQGKYVFGDYGSTSGASDGRLMGLEETAPNSGVFTLTQAVPLLGLANPILGQRILCLGEDQNGEIYVGMKTKGGVLELDDGLPSGGIYKLMPVETTTANLSPSQDNTIFSESGSLSDGRGYLYAGRTGINSGSSDVRRALLAFNVAVIPEGAQIQSAQMRLRVAKIGPSGAGKTLTLQRLNEAWGEGTSANLDGGTGAAATTSDATWTQRFFNTSPWSTAGGVFQGTVSSSTLAASGLITFASTAQMIADVQGWISAPATNAGWIVLSDEATDGTACQFDSLQQGITLPLLTVVYDLGPQPMPFENWLAAYYPTNLTGQFVDPNGDDDGDGIQNQIEYAYGLSPVSRDASSDFTAVTAPGADDATDFIVTFRRDTSAADLTYQLQISSNLTQWTTIALCSGSDSASGENGGEIVSEEGWVDAVNLVTVKATLPAGSNSRQFVRLQVDRE